MLSSIRFTMTMRGGSLMLCDNCKIRHARIYYTEIIDGVKKEQHLCEECAKQYTTFQIEAPMLTQQFTLGDLLSTIYDTYEAKGENERSKNTITCKNCNTTYQQFIQQGTFGCSECYESFKEVLERSLKKIQGANKHIGKVPKGFQTSTQQIVSSLSEVDRLSIQLQQAVEKEEFEEAAKLRDEIRRLKKKEEMKNA